MADATESLPGQRVWDRLDARMARRQAVGVPSRLYERMGLGDPWSWKPPASDASTENDDYAFLSGRPFYAMMRRMALSRFWRERRERWADVGPQRAPAKRRRRTNRFDWSLGTSDFVLPPAWEVSGREEEVEEAPTPTKAVSGWTGARTSSGAAAWQTASVPSTATVIRGGQKKDAPAATVDTAGTTGKDRRAAQLVAETGHADRTRRREAARRPAGLRHTTSDVGADEVRTAPARQRRRGVRYRTARRVADAELLRQLEAPTPTSGTTAVRARSPFLSTISESPARQAARRVSARAAEDARPDAPRSAPRPTGRATTSSTASTPRASSPGRPDAQPAAGTAAPTGTILQRSVASQAAEAAPALPAERVVGSLSRPDAARPGAPRLDAARPDAARPDAARVVPATERLAQRALTALPTAERAAAPDLGASSGPHQVGAGTSGSRQTGVRPSMRWEGPMAPEGRRRVLRVASPSLAWLMGAAPETEAAPDAPARQTGSRQTSSARPPVSAWPAPRPERARSVPEASAEPRPAAARTDPSRAGSTVSTPELRPAVAGSPAAPSGATTSRAATLTPVERTLRAMGASTSVMQAVREAIEVGARSIPAPAARLLARTLPPWEQPGSSRVSGTRPAGQPALTEAASTTPQARIAPATAPGLTRPGLPRPGAHTAPAVGVATETEAAPRRSVRAGLPTQQVVRVAAPEDAPPDRIAQLIQGVERSAETAGPRQARPRRSVWISPNEVLLVPEGDPVPAEASAAAASPFAGARTVSGWARPASPVGRAVSVGVTPAATPTAGRAAGSSTGPRSTLIPPSPATAYRTPTGEWHTSAAFRTPAGRGPAASAEVPGFGVISRTVAGVWAGASKADRAPLVPGQAGSTSAPAQRGAASVRRSSAASGVSTDSVIVPGLRQADGTQAASPDASQPFTGARTVSGWTGAPTTGSPTTGSPASADGARPSAASAARPATAAERRLDADPGLAADTLTSARGQRRRAAPHAPALTSLSVDGPVARAQGGGQDSGASGARSTGRTSPYFSPVSQAVADAWSGPGPRQAGDAGVSSRSSARPTPIVPSSTTRVSRTPSALRGTTRSFRTASGVWSGAVLARTPEGEWTGAASGRTPVGEWSGASSSRTPTGGWTGAPVSTTPSGAWTGAASGRTPSGEFIGASSSRTPGGAWTGAASGRTPSGEFVGASSSRTPSGAWTGAASGRTPSGQWTGAASGRTPRGEWVGASSGVTPPGWHSARPGPQRTSLMQSLAAVGDGEDTVNLPSWARVVTASPIRRRAAGDLVTALARATQPEQVIRVILERAGQPVPANLPAPIAEVVRQVTGEAAKVGESVSRQTGSRSTGPNTSAPGATVIRGGRAASGGSARSVRTRGGDTRSSARVVSGWTGLGRGAASTAKTASPGVGPDKMMRLASRLKELIHLAEGQKLSEARKQARLSAEGTGPESGGEATRVGGAGEQEVDIDVLSREVLEIVMQELEFRRARRVEDSDVGLWW